MAQLYVNAGYVESGYVQGASIYAELHKLDAGAWVDLFDLDLTPLGGSVVRFHAGTNKLRQAVVWQGNTYQPFPIQAEGFDVSGSEMPRPKLRVANVAGALSALVREYDDLVGMRVTRKRTMVQYLDAENFAPQRNLITQSETFSAWTATDASVTSDAAMAPTGEQVMDKLVESTAASTQHNLGRSFSSASAGAGTVVVLSVHAKAGERRHLALQFLANAAGFTTSRSCYFDLATGQMSTPPSGFSARMIQVDKATWRCVFWGPADGAGAVSSRIYLATSLSTSSYTGDGASGLYLWGAQLETGSLTDYQPVLGSSFVRNPTADPYSFLPDEVFFVVQKTMEHRLMVEFELGSSLDLQGVMLPRRQILGDYCAWRYRDNDVGACSYTGGPVADRFNQPTTDASKDQCSRTIAGCKLRFGENAVLPFGGFASVNLGRQ